MWLINLIMLELTRNKCCTSGAKMSILCDAVIWTNAIRGFRGVDPYGTGGTRPPIFGLGGHDHECPPQYL